MSPDLIPMFGTAAHTPALCGEPDANAAPRRSRKRAAATRGPCRTCGGRIAEGSSLVCMSCHSVSPDVAPRVARHHKPPLDHDGRRDVEPRRAAKLAIRLTAKERKALLADARAGEQPLPAVEQFLASLDAAKNGDFPPPRPTGLVEGFTASLDAA